MNTIIQQTIVNDLSSDIKIGAIIKNIESVIGKLPAQDNLWDFHNTLVDVVNNLRIIQGHLIAQKAMVMAYIKLDEGS